MKFTSMFDLWIAIVGGVVAFGSSIIVEFQWLSASTPFRVLKYSGILVSGFFAVRSWLRNRPYIMEVNETSWTVERLDNHKGVYVDIPARKHKKGKLPTIHLMRSERIHGAVDLQYEIGKNGDVRLFHPANSFMRPWKSCYVKILP